MKYFSFQIGPYLFKKTVPFKIFRSTLFLLSSVFIFFISQPILAQTTTATTVAALPNICAATPSITLSATVSPNPLEGSVQFRVNGVDVGSPVDVSGGSAFFDFISSNLSGGAHSVTAIFSGNGTFSTSTSSSVVLMVNTVNPGLIAKGLTNQGPVCNTLNPNITLVPNGTTSIAATGNGVITYLWQQSTDGGATWTSAAIVSPETSNTSAQFNPGTMTSTTKLRRVGISTQNSVACTSFSNELEYVVYPLPFVAPITSASNVVRVCEGSTLQLFNESIGGIWDSNNTANITINGDGLVTGVSAVSQSNLNITYKITDGNGCSKTINKTITVIALPTITSNASVCIGASFNLTPGSGGVWVSNNSGVASVTNAGLVTGVSSGTATFTFTSNTAPGCSKTTQDVKAGCDPFPVTLSNFSVKNKENAVFITWETTSELNSSHFEIEKSINSASGFFRISSVPSKDDQSGGSYHYEDFDLPKAPVVYYRLRMVDWDGSFAYSRIQQIKPRTISKTELYPNPASQFLNIETYNWQNIVSIKIHRNNGELIYELESNQLAKKLDVSKLSSALYTLEITRSDGTREFKKFAVTR